MTTFSIEKPKKPIEFVCYRRNILMDYGVKSVEEKVEADTIIEAAMVYHKKHGHWPDEIYRKEMRPEEWKQLEILKHQTAHITEQRDRFANAVAIVESEREAAFKEIDRLYNAIRQAITDVNMKMRNP